MILGLLRGCSYDPVGGIMDIPIVEPEPSTEYTINLVKTRYPYVLSVTIENASDPYIRNMLDVHVLHTGVVGRFGCPVEVEGATENSRLIFRYDPENMKQVPARNLIGLYYNEEEYNYEELEPTLDEANHTVTFDIDRDGAYMLVDLYEWFRAWGAELPEYAHPLEFTFEGGEYPSYYPSFSAVIPEGTTLSFSSDLEWTNDRTGYVVKDYFSSTDESDLRIRATVIRGDKPWRDALSGANYIRSNPVGEDGPLFDTLEELVKEPERIIFLMSSSYTGEPLYYATVYYCISGREYVSMEVSIPLADKDELEGELRDFVTGIKFCDTNNPWYKNA